MHEQIKHSNLPWIAWAAGFIDGEGCLHITKQKYKSPRTGEVKTTHTFKIHIAQVNLEVLERIKNVLGVHANIHKIKRNIRSNRQAYTLNYTGKHAYKAMNMVMPFLVRKRPEAEAVNLF